MDLLPKLKIKGKLSIAFVGFSALPILVLGILAWNMISKSMKDSSVRDLSHLAEVINIRLNDFTKVVQTDLQFIIESFQSFDSNGKATSPGAPDKTIIEKQALNLMHTRPFYSCITFLVDSLKAEWFGLQRSPFNPEQIDTHNYRYSWNYYRLLVQDLTGEQMRFVPIENIDLVTNKTYAAFTYAMPYRDEQENLVGILIINIFADQIFSIIETTLDETTHYTAGIVDSEGRYLYHSAKKKDWNQLITESDIHKLQYDFNDDLVENIVSETPGVFRSEQGDVVYHIPLNMGALSLNQKYFFYLTQPGSVIFAPIRNLRLISLIVAVIFIALAFILSRVATEHFVNPIQRLQKGSDIIAEGNFSHRIEITTGDEIERLAEKFNYMARSIKERDQQLKSYSSSLEEQIARRTRELQDEKDKLRIILDNIPSTLILIDSERNILASSSEIKQLTGYTSSHVLGLKCCDILNIPQMCDHCVIGASKETQKQIRKDYSVENTDGQIRTFEVFRIPVELTSGEKAYVEILSDITRRVHLQNQLLQSEKLASMGEMAAVIAHEIRNSLTSANMLLQLIHESDNLETAEKESLEVVLTSNSRINKITNDLLAFARPAPLDKQPVNPIDLIYESVALYKKHFESYNIQTELQLQDTLPMISVDSNLICEVLANILLNAYQAVESDGKVTVKAKMVSMMGDITDRVEFNFVEDSKFVAEINHKSKTDQALVIEIQDDGPGIPGEDIRKIFDPFFTTKINGTGLGLSMTKRVVEAHGGYIYAASKDGHCATITMIIPSEAKS